MSSNGEKTLPVEDRSREQDDADDLKALIYAQRGRNSSNDVSSLLKLASQLPKQPGPRTRFPKLNRFLARLQAAYRAFKEY